MTPSLASKVLPPYGAETTAGHGERRCYTINRCARPECKRAHADYQARRRRLLAYGKWKGQLVPAAAAYRPLRWLRSGGASNVWIAQQLGVSRQRASQLTGGRHPMVRLDTVERVELLVAQVEAAELTPPGWVEPRTAGTLRYVSAEPIVREVGERGGFNAVVPGGRSRVPEVAALRAAYQRAKASGVATDVQADQLCVGLLRLHPCELYGDEWWELDAAAVPGTQEKGQAA